MKKSYMSIAAAFLLLGYTLYSFEVNNTKEKHSPPECSYSNQNLIMTDDTRFREHILDIPFQYAYGIGIGDFNNDGRKDISVADAIEGTFSLLEQKEDTTFKKNRETDGMSVIKLSIIKGRLSFGL